MTKYVDQVKYESFLYTHFVKYNKTLKINDKNKIYIFKELTFYCVIHSIVLYD